MKRIREIIDKYFVAILCTITISFGGFVWDYMNRFFSLPSRVEKLETKIKNDSISCSQKNKLKDSTIMILNQRLGTLEGFVDDDYKRLNKIEQELIQNK